MTEVNNDPYTKVVNDLVNQFKPLVKRWSAGRIGSLDSWIGLLKEVMKMINTTDLSGGVAKATVAVDVIQGLAGILISENVAKLNDDQMKIVNLILSDEGASVLRLSTGLLHQVIQSMDTDNDGKISGAEFKSWWKRTFCFCC